jgi:hypothetical protein
VIIDAQKLNRIFSINNNLNITFINGNISNNCGAIFNAYSGTTLAVINCTFTNNSGNYAGAVLTRGNTTIKNSIFTSNAATYDGGGLAASTNANAMVYVDVLIVLSLKSC